MSAVVRRPRKMWRRTRLIASSSPEDGCSVVGTRARLAGLLEELDGPTSAGDRLVDTGPHLGAVVAPTAHAVEEAGHREARAATAGGTRRARSSTLGSSSSNHSTAFARNAPAATTGRRRCRRSAGPGRRRGRSSSEGRRSHRRSVRRAPPVHRAGRQFGIAMIALDHEAVDPAGLSRVPRNAQIPRRRDDVRPTLGRRVRAGPDRLSAELRIRGGDRFGATTAARRTDPPACRVKPRDGLARASRRGRRQPVGVGRRRECGCRQPVSHQRPGTHLATRRQAAPRPRHRADPRDRWQELPTRRPLLLRRGHQGGQHDAHLAVAAHVPRRQGRAVARRHRPRRPRLRA